MIKSVLSVGVSVKNLDRAVAFYLNAAGFKEDARVRIENDGAIQELFGIKNSGYTSSILQAKTTGLEIIQFESPSPDSDQLRMPVIGPGITHVCYQSPSTDPAYAKFKNAGASLISRGDHPIDLAGAGITYAYLRDPDGNIFESEQLDQPPLPYSVWMGHVSLVTNNIERLSSFYSTILLGNASPSPKARFAKGPKMDEVADLDNLEIWMVWIRGLNLTLEFCQYDKPATPQPTGKRPVQRFGYNWIKFEVDHLQEEYKRLLQLGVEFQSTPVQTQGAWAVLGYDPDGNPFQLIQ